MRAGRGLRERTNGQVPRGSESHRQPRDMFQTSQMLRTNPPAKPE